MKVIYTLIFFIITITSSSKATDSLSLYFFLLDDCPICIQYSPTINELYNEYGDQISFIGYFPNFSSKKHKIDAYKNEYNIKFPLQTDYYKVQAKKYNAEVTPEVILYNNTKDKIIYQGRIDNKFFKLGRRRNVVTEHDLKSAIDNTINNEPVEKSYVQPVGCFINYNDNFGQKTKTDNK